MKAFYVLLPQLIASCALWWSSGLSKRFCGISSRRSNSFILCCTWVTPEQLNCRRLQMPINVQQVACMFSCLSTYLQITKACKRDFTHLNSRKSLEAWNLNLDFKKAMAFSRSKTISLVRSRFSQWEVSTPFIEPIYEHQQRTFDFVNNSLNFVH